MKFIRHLTSAYILLIVVTGCCKNESIQNLYPSDHVKCTENFTQVVEVKNPVTGRVWMDRNLGASRKATAINDAQSFGDLYQWGRYADGHQCRNSKTTNELIVNPASDRAESFVISNLSNINWTGTLRSELWLGVDAVNNPCPNGFRLPTVDEWMQEINTWQSLDVKGAFESSIKLPAAGRRLSKTGIIDRDGTEGYYWTANANGDSGLTLAIGSNVALIGNTERGRGDAIRCIKD